MQTTYAQRELRRWAANYSNYDWSDALAMTARRMVNSEGPCGNEGDEYGNRFSQVLSRYYSYSY